LYQKEFVQGVTACEWALALQPSPSSDSGVESFEIGPDFIKVQFHDGVLYLYTDQSAGRENIEQMKRLARAVRD
jgi:hypothetical protein